MVFNTLIFVFIDNNLSSKIYSTILFDISICGAIKLSISYTDKYFIFCIANGDNKTSTSDFNIFKGYLNVKIIVVSRYINDLIKFILPPILTI